MRARTRLILDIALLAGFVAAYRPSWTGITLHQWLSIAIVVPALVHLIVNWEWALRIVRTFIQKLFSASRLNFVVDSALLLTTTAVTVSGFMVSPGLIAPLGIHVAHALEWHLVHSWTADATIVLVLVHTALHWRWWLSASKQLFGQRPEATTARPALTPSTAATATMANAVARSARTSRASATARGGRHAVGHGKSRVGTRAKQAAAERAAVRRTVSVLGLTTFLGFAIFTGIGLASPLFPKTLAPQTVAGGHAKTLVCPKTGCSASSCHADSGMSAQEFYKKHPDAVTTASTAKPSTRSAKRPAKHAASFAHVPAMQTTVAALDPIVPPAAKVAASASPAKATAAATATSKPAAKAAAKPAAKPVVKKKLQTCPQTGCQRARCHADYGQSASSFY